MGAQVVNRFERCKKRILEASSIKEDRLGKFMYCYFVNDLTITMQISPHTQDKEYGCGFKGVIVPDLSHNEKEELYQLCKEHLNSIQEKEKKLILDSL